MNDKVTFYDLVVYLLPGGMLLGGCILILDECIIWNQEAAFKNFSFFFQCMLLLLSYIVGFAVHTLAEFLEKDTGNNRILWKTSWVTQELKKLKDEKRNPIMQHLASKSIDENGLFFQTSYFEQIRKEVIKDNYTAQTLRTLHAQSMMFRNSFTSFLALAIVAMLYYATAGCWKTALLSALTWMVLSALCFYMTIMRKRVIIRTILWKYSSVVQSSKNEKDNDI